MLGGVAGRAAKKRSPPTGDVTRNNFAGLLLSCAPLEPPWTEDSFGATQIAQFFGVLGEIAKSHAISVVSIRQMCRRVEAGTRQ